MRHYSLQIVALPVAVVLPLVVPNTLPHALKAKKHLTTLTREHSPSGKYLCGADLLFD